MANKLIKNETNVFYTIEIIEGVMVNEATAYGGKVDKVGVTRESHKVKKFVDEKWTQKVAAYINGKIIKHTQTEVITEVTVEIKFEEEK